ncbi:cell division protein FtsQ [Diaminobutyricimonas aerilata]|uniref:Cell division protein FtsQ n=1 Tax=Diaminobutyricimonas aerilata TaxID=1162967 RepID=A0A2M9CKG2_9MICO|nr:cell division protein FtsQ [Diaminobutyricimonas aerilata]
MKRPEGFDPRPPQPEATPEPRRTVRSPRRTARAPKSSPQAEEPVPGRPVTPAPPAIGTPVLPDAAASRLREREARAALRRAARERARVERDEVRRFTRRTRHRRAIWWTAGGIVAAFAVAVSLAVFSPLLALREIRITGTERIPQEQLHAVLDEQLGTPLALVDLDAVERELAEFPLIRNYVTEVVPPDTLVVRLQERQPIALVQGDGGFDLVDPAGVVVQTTPERPPGVPLLTLPDGDLDSAGFDWMVEVLLALPPEVLAQVDSISAPSRDSVTLDLAGSEQRVLWGSATDSDRKAAVLARLIPLHAGAGAGEYDVSAERTAVFRPD